MSYFETATATLAYRVKSEDRLAVFVDGDRTVIVVADGAGGMGSGSEAAETVVREVKAAVPAVHSADQWAQTLSQIDHRIAAGESTAIVVDLRPYGIAGASVGDSQAWIVNDGQMVQLTGDQSRKPLLGSGEASPVAFMHNALTGLLIAGTDGFFNYCKADEVPRLIAKHDFHSLARKCIEHVRLPSGDLWDDTSIAVTRVTPLRRTRQKYRV